MAKVDVGKLEDLHEEMADMMADQEEVQEVLGRDYALDAYNEGELNDQLNELDEEIVNEKLEGAESVPSYVPQKIATAPVAQTGAKKEQEDLEQIMNH